MVSKTVFISRSERVPDPSRELQALPNPSFDVVENCQLTYQFFALNTGNVFFRSTFHRRFNRVARRINPDTARNGRCVARQKISKMLCLARGECQGAILSGRLNSRAQQKRLSSSQALRHCAERQHTFSL